MTTERDALERLRRDPTARRRLWAALTRRAAWPELDALQRDATPEDAAAIAALLLEHGGWRLDIAARSDTGPRRTWNEDAAAIASRAAAVADGMGGIASGRGPALLAVHLILTALTPDAPPHTFTSRYEDTGEPERVRHHAEQALAHLPPSDGDPAARLRAAFTLAHDTIQALQKVTTPRFSYRGSAATAAALLIEGGRLFIGHVGDVRVYRLRGGDFEALTREHTLATTHLERTGEPIPESHEHYANIVIRALGFAPEHLSWETDGVDVACHGPTRRGDTLLIASDGLHRNVEDAVLARLLEDEDPARATERLVQAAVQTNANDNITALVLRVS